MTCRILMLLLILAGGSAFAQSSRDTCVDVQVGAAQSYACINQKLAAEAKNAHGSVANGDAVPAGIPPANQTGQFNEDATRNRLGANFGKSVTPARPQTSFPPAFGAPK